MCFFLFVNLFTRREKTWPVCRFDVLYYNKATWILPLQRGVTRLLINVVLFELIGDIAVTVVVLIHILLQLVWFILEKILRGERQKKTKIWYGRVRQFQRKNNNIQHKNTQESTHWVQLEKGKTSQLCLWWKFKDIFPKIGWFFLLFC